MKKSIISLEIHFIGKISFGNCLEKTIILLKIEISMFSKLTKKAHGSVY